MKTKRFFYPEEIIFACTDACNLHCPHCFVSRESHKLNPDDAVKFLQSCIDYSAKTNQTVQIQKIGFSGGEPFLYTDFLKKIIAFSVKNDFLFDQIMTNGDWWKTESDLKTTLQEIYDAGYDGKIGLSYDIFHNQNFERIKTFIQYTKDIFGNDSIVVQSVGTDLTFPEMLKSAFPDIKIYNLPQSFESTDLRGWKSKKWFKDDYCTGPGNILYVHANGNIAPCCGFANENDALIIGKITDDFETILKNSSQTPMIKLCFTDGLSKAIKQVKKLKIKFPGKTTDICTFCDFICKL